MNIAKLFWTLTRTLRVQAPVVTLMSLIIVMVFMTGDDSNTALGVVTSAVFLGAIVRYVGQRFVGAFHVSRIGTAGFSDSLKALGVAIAISCETQQMERYEARPWAKQAWAGIDSEVRTPGGSSLGLLLAALVLIAGNQAWVAIAGTASLGLLCALAITLFATEFPTLGIASPGFAVANDVPRARTKATPQQPELNRK